MATNVETVRQLAELMASNGSPVHPATLPGLVGADDQTLRETTQEALLLAVTSAAPGRLDDVFGRLPGSLGDKIACAKAVGTALQTRGDHAAQALVHDLIRRHAPRNFWVYFDFANLAIARHDHRRALEILSMGLELCTGRITPTEQQNLTQVFLKTLCLAHRDDRVHYQALAARVRHTGRPVPDALFVAMVKDEEDIVGDCLAAAYQCGLRYFVIANNGSTDSTGAKISAFAAAHGDCVVLVVNDPIKGYWQDKKTNALWKFGKEYLAMLGVDIQWVVPVDADEILVQTDADHDLASVFEQASAAGKQLGVHMWCTATPTAVVEALDDTTELSQLFSVVSGYDQTANTKVVMRASANGWLEMGNHFATGCLKSASEAFRFGEHGIFMIHHPFRSRRQLRQKIVNGYHALTSSDLPAAAGRHWRMGYEKYMREGESHIDETLQSYFTRNLHSAQSMRAAASADEPRST